MIGLREDQRVKEGLVIFLNNAAAQCGSGLAREGSLPVTDSLTDPPLSRASPLPHCPVAWLRKLTSLAFIC